MSGRVEDLEPDDEVAVRAVVRGGYDSSDETVLVDVLHGLGAVGMKYGRTSVVHRSVLVLPARARVDLLLEGVKDELTSSRAEYRAAVADGNRMQIGYWSGTIDALEACRNGLMELLDELS